MSILDLLFSDKGEAVVVSDSDIPKGKGGINREGYTYGFLRKVVIQPELYDRLTNHIVRAWVDEARQCVRPTGGFIMRKVNGEYCFDDLRVGPRVKLPTVSELRSIIERRYDGAASRRRATKEMIRTITYEILRATVAKESGSSDNIIGNSHDCAPHEDISGYMFMVPKWAHNWFEHRGYAARMEQEINK